MLADVYLNLTAITSRIQRRYNSTTIRSLPPTHIPRNPTWRFFDRTRAANISRGVPGEFLCRESLQAGVRENARQRCRKTKTVGQHVLSARFAKLALKKSIAVEYLPKDRLSRRRIHIALFHRRASGKPATRGNIRLQA